MPLLYVDTRWMLLDIFSFFTHTHMVRGREKKNIQHNTRVSFLSLFIMHHMFTLEIYDDDDILLNVFHNKKKKKEPHLFWTPSFFFLFFFHLVTPVNFFSSLSFRIPSLFSCLKLLSLTINWDGEEVVRT